MNHDEQSAAVQRVAWEVEHNPDGPIAQAVGRAMRAAGQFGQAFAALERDVQESGTRITEAFSKARGEVAGGE